MQCQVYVTLVFYDSGGACSSTPSTLISGNSDIWPTCSAPCGTITDVRVILDLVNGNAITSGSNFVDVSNTTASGGYAVPICTGGSTPTYNMTWATSNADVSY
ncbi:MAG: hypothetical protein PSX36_13495 [bacterium]|nr:hypothetical protein [bacterium]